MDPKRTIYINVIGDKLVGKRRMLVVYKSKIHKGNVKDPDKNLLSINVDGEESPISLQDISGQEDYKKFRRSTYKKINVFIICYAIDNEISYKNVKERWYKEVLRINPKATIILVGTKSDLRDSKKNVLSYEYGEKMGWEIKASKFLECTVKNLESIDQVIKDAVRCYRDDSKVKHSNDSKANFHFTFNNNIKKNMVEFEASSSPDKERIRITVVGDGMTGKTCLLISYKDKKFDTEYIPTVFDSYSMDILINDVVYEIILNDTAGQEEYDRLRSLGYNKTDVFVICYSIDSPSSYENVWNKWYPELNHFRSNSPKILAATKIDLRNGAPPGSAFLNFEKGLDMQKKVKAEDFIECSAKEGYHVDEVFKQALLAALKYRTKKKKIIRTCVLL